MGVQDETAPSAPPAPEVLPEEQAKAAPAVAEEQQAPAVSASPSTPAEAQNEYKIGPTDCSVVLSGLSTSVTEQMVRDFVEFCGDVVKIDIKEDAKEEGKCYAIVEFVDVSAVDDALICSGAIVGDCTVSVSKLEVIQGGPDGFDRAVGRAKTATETAQKVIAAGYVKGEQAISVIKQKALQFDETHNVSTRAREANIPEKAKGIANSVASVGATVAARVTGKPQEYSEEQKQEYQNAGQRNWNQSSVSSQPQW